ncbi:MAG: hypothetical protein HDQ88_10055, partial [Clostridia bacterium]|nr:hypothetical protein [Clostridia bacterium]
MATILPSGEEVSITPDKILRYLNPDGVRQLVRQEMLMFQTKTDSDVSYIDNQRLFKYAGEMHNKGLYQKAELRTYPDNGAYEGYAGLYNDTGILGVAHNADKWDKAMSEESKKTVVNRTMLTASAKVDEKTGYGLDDNGEMSVETTNRMTGVIMDPYDGRTY